MSGGKSILAGIALALLISSATGCGSYLFGHAATDEEVSNLEGEITIDGSSTVQPLTTAAAESFLAIHPHVQIPVGTSGTGGGFKKFVVGELDLSNASRPINAEEFAKCKKHDVEFIEIPVAFDALSIAVNPKNDFVDVLTVEQLGKIYREDKAAKTWRELNPDWPDEPLRVFSPGTDSGTFDYFREVLGGKKISIRQDLQTNEDDNVLVQGVEGDRGAIAYFGAAYAFGAGDKIKIVPIINPQTGVAVMPSEATVVGGDYRPFSRPLFVYANIKALHTPQGELFMEHYLDHAGEFAKTVGYFPLPSDSLKLAHEHVRDLRSGTCFVTADGQSRHGVFIDLFHTKNLVSTK